MDKAKEDVGLCQARGGKTENVKKYNAAEKFKIENDTKPRVERLERGLNVANYYQYYTRSNFITTAEPIRKVGRRHSRKLVEGGHRDAPACVSRPRCSERLIQ